jgi:hypothetical protein
MTVTIDLVFNPDFGGDPRATVQQAIDALPAGEFGPFGPPRAEPLVGRVSYQRWLTAGKEIALDLTDDQSVPVVLLSIICEDEQRAVGLAQALWSFVNAQHEVWLGPDALVQRAAAPGAQPADLVRAAVAEKGRYNSELHQHISAALQSANRAWREAAAKGAAVAGWPELARDVGRALAKEQDPEIKRMLQMAHHKVQP